MTTRNRQNLSSRDKNLSTAKEQVATSVDGNLNSAPAPVELDARATSGSRIWALPTVTPTIFWAVAEASRVQLTESPQENLPVICAAKLNPRDRAQAADCGQRAVNRHFRDRFHEASFSLIKRLIISFVWVGVSAISLRLPGEFKVIDAFVLLAGLGYFSYSVLRYGSQMARWHNRRVDAMRAFANVQFSHSPLIERLTNALKFRAKLRLDERGKSPDDELLDTNAYRKLIKDGITTAEELSALGRAISAEIKTTTLNGQERKISDIAAETGLDVDTTIFYRDLAAAAREIELIPDELRDEL